MKRTRIGALLIGAGLLVAACTGGSASPSPAEPTAPPASGEPTAPPSEAAQPKPGGTLVRRCRATSSARTRRSIDDSNSSYVMNQVMEGLVGLKPGTTGDIIPVLASALPSRLERRPDVHVQAPGRHQVPRRHRPRREAVKYNYDRWLNIPADYSSWSTPTTSTRPSSRSWHRSPATAPTRRSRSRSSRRTRPSC